MASLRTKLEDELECSLCLDRLKDPRAFPCQHSFCYQCIVDLSQGKSKISCPECRAEVEVGDPPDLSCFKRNHRINNILECMDIALQGSTNSDAQQQSNSSQTPIYNDGTVQKVGPDTAENGNEQQQQRKNDLTSMNYQQQASSPLQCNLNVGSDAQALSKNQETKYGAPGRPGHIPNKSCKKSAGLELEKEMHSCTDETFLVKQKSENVLGNEMTTDANLKNVKDPETFYILLKNSTAEKQLKAFSFGFHKKCITLQKGTILFHNRDTAVVDKINSGFLRLHACERPSYISYCRAEDVDEIDEEEARLFLSFTSIDERFKFYKDISLKNGKKMTVGTNVYVKVRSPSGGLQELRGVIKYKGSLPNVDDVMFGVELKEGRGRGTTDGRFRGKRYFRCDTDCGLFVTIEKLRLCDDATRTKSGNISDTNEVKESEEDNSGVITKFRKKLSERMSAGHKLDDRVWVCINDKLYGGFILYIGRTPGGKEIHAGIELDNPVGQGNGEYCGKQLFCCSMNHAYFTRIENVMSNAQFRELDDQPTHLQVASSSALKDNSPSAPQTSADIVKMESDFSKKSTDQVIKEQEEILRKIQEENRKSQK